MASENQEQPTRRFNYFVAVQITDKQLVKNIVATQDSIISEYPQFADSRSLPNGLHLTLAVLKLDTDSEKQTCVETMNTIKKDIERSARMSVPLSFQGLDSFTTKVIFATVKYSSEFLELVDLIRDRLSKAGLKMENRPFKPHLTLFNVERSVYSDKKWSKRGLHLAWYAGEDFGSQPVHNIQVCKMGTLPKEEGSGDFYEGIFYMDIK